MKFISYLFKRSSSVFNSLIIFGFSAFLAGCSWGDQIEALVQPNPDDFAVLFSDSSTVTLATVSSDSVMTGGPSRLLAGRYLDPYFGKVRTASFFQASTTSGIAVPTLAIYDSLTLALPLDGYTYGDTTKVFNLNVHALLADILDKNVYYNHNTTEFDPKPIGKFSGVVRPKTSKTLQIRLSDTLGRDIFQKGQNNLITNNNEWINILKGIMIAPNANDNGPVMGISLSNIAVKLHYHLQEVDGIRKDSAVVSVQAGYNQITGDYAGTLLANLPGTKRVALPSARSGNLSFIQAGNGLMTRVDFPYVRLLKYNRYTVVNRAFLRMYPYKASVTDPLAAPAEISVYLCDKNNAPFISSSDGLAIPLYQIGSSAAVKGTYINDMVNNTQYYLFDVSAFVTSLINDGLAEGTGLLLRTSPFSSVSTSYLEAGTEFGKSVNRLVIGSQQSNDPGVKLELYYTNVNVE